MKPSSREVIADAIEIGQRPVQDGPDAEVTRVMPVAPWHWHG
jgi:hypothetical protein